jgi:anaerobic selenocysteine-containing dehydrogenase
MAESQTADTRVHLRSCAFCEAGCGIEVTADHASRRVLGVRGDKRDPFSQGYICPKAYALTELHSDPDRLRMPVRRKGRDFEEIGWDEAFDEAADRLGRIKAEHGPNAIGYYFGNPSGHKGPLLIYGGMLIGALGTSQVYSPGTLDQIPKQVSGALMFGGALVQPLADLDRTDYLVIIGSNPVVSQGSMIVAPGFRHRIEAIRKRGGKVVVIDPRRTETADIADEHLAVMPGTDAFLLFAMLHVLFAENRITLGRAEGLVRNLDTLEREARAWPPERVAAITGIDADTIRRIAREMADAPTAAMHGRTGTCTQRFGTITGWLIDALNAVTGNLDIPGGSMFAAYGIPTPILFNAKWEDGKPPVGRWHSRATGLPEALGMLPTAALADEILTSGEGQVRGFVTQAGNVLLSNPNGAKLAEAFGSLDFMLSLDIYVNETTRHADIIIPGPSYAEHADFAAVTPYEMIRKYLKWAPPVFAPDPAIRTDPQIFTALAARLSGVSEADAERGFFEAMVSSALAQGRPECAHVSLETACAALGDEPGADRIFDAMIRSGPYGDAFGQVPDGLTLDRLREHPHGLDLGPLTPQLPDVLETPDGLIDMAPEMLVADVPRMERWIEEAGEADCLLMIGRRTVRSKNAWMHNLKVLVKGKDRCTLLMHPRDAAARAISAGDTARVSTRIGAIEAPVEISDEMRPGVVSLPHGWGHDMPDTQQAVAAAHPGVNANLIIDQMGLNAPTATTILNGVPVSVERVVQAEHPAQAEAAE